MTKKWKYLLVGFLTLVFVFFLVLPGVIGYLAHKAITKSVEQSSDEQIKHLYIEFKLLSYIRHWFYSDMASLTTLRYPFLRFFFNSDSTELPKVGIYADTVFHHGPVIITPHDKEGKTLRLALAYGETTGHLTDDTKQVIEQNWTGNIPEFTSNYLVKFNQRFVWCNDNPAFNLKNKNNDMSISFGGGKTCANSNWGISDVINDLNFGPIRMDKPSELLSLGADSISIHYEEKKYMFGERPLWPGQYWLKIPYVWLNKGKYLSLQVTDLTLTSKSHLNTTWYDITTNVLVKRLILNQLDLGTLNYSGTFSHFDAPSFSKMRDFITVQSLALPFQEMTRLALTHWSLLESFIAKEPIYELHHLTLQGQLGELKAQGYIRLLPQHSKIDIQQILNDTNVFKQLLNVDAHLSLSVSKSLAEKLLQQIHLIILTFQQPKDLASPETLALQKAQTQLQEWINTKMLIEKEGQLQTNLVYKNGVIAQTLLSPS